LEKERSHADSRITQRPPVTPVHRLVAIARNGWSRSIGTPGRNQSEQLVAIIRCAQSVLPTLEKHLKEAQSMSKQVAAKR